MSDRSPATSGSAFRSSVERPTPQRLHAAAAHASMAATLFEELAATARKAGDHAEAAACTAQAAGLRREIQYRTPDAA